MTTYMTTEQVASLDARVLTATVNDAIRAVAFGYATYEQAEFLSQWEADVEIDRLAEDENGIYTASDGDETDEYWRESEFYGYSDPYGWDEPAEYPF